MTKLMQLLYNYDIKYVWFTDCILNLIADVLRRYDYIFIYKYTIFSPPSENYSINVSILSIHVPTGRWSCADRTTLINEDDNDDDDSHFWIFSQWTIVLWAEIGDDWNQLFPLNGRIKRLKLFNSACELMTYELWVMYVII